LAAAGVPGVLLTSPVVGAVKLDAFAKLAGKTQGLMGVVDNPVAVRALEAALRRSGGRAGVLVDVDIGMRRTALPTVAGVLDLARRLSASATLTFAGVQAYSGRVQHITRGADRARVYGKQLKHLEAVLDGLIKAGMAPRIVSGGGTGSFAIDRRAGLFTEVQCGSCALMDIEYQDVQLFARGVNPYQTALRVQCAVVSNNHPGFATIDGGFKCFHMNGPLPRAVTGVPPGSLYEFAGDEFGQMTLARKRGSLTLGAKVELPTPHCDPTVNLHSHYQCVRGNTLVDIWPVDARGSL
jgi:D-serine deaminase-like pyridoxal phosphate-dependent protein